MENADETRGPKNPRGHKRGPGRGPRKGHGRGPEGGGHKGGPRGGGRRPLKHGDLKYLLLALIKDGPRHGYDLMSDIERQSGGRYRPSPGSLYPAIEVMRDLGWLKSDDGDDKRALSLTQAGLDEINASADRIAGILNRLKNLGKNKGEAEDGSPRHALRRLRHLSKAKLTEKPSSEKDVFDIISKAIAQIEAL